MHETTHSGQQCLNTTKIKKLVDAIVNVRKVERKMQPARGRFARSDLDRQMASTIPAHWKVGPAPVFWASRPLEPAE